MVKSLPSIAKGLSGWRLTHSCPCRHSSEGSPAWMQVVERRREQAAEESRRGGRGVKEARFIRWRVGLSCLWLSFPLCGNGLCKSLDSGLRRAATGLLPSRRIPDFLSINDGGAGVRNSAGMAEGLSG